MSESESDPMNSTVNTREIPRMYIPPERAKSNPNILGFGMHFSSRPLPGLGGGACLGGCPSNQPPSPSTPLN